MKEARQREVSTQWSGERYLYCGTYLQRDRESSGCSKVTCRWDSWGSSSGFAVVIMKPSKSKSVAHFSMQKEK